MAGKTSAKPKPKAPAKKTEMDPLAMCPVNGAGWCPYPFSAAQLKRRLKAKQAEAAAKAQATKATKTTKALKQPGA